MKKLVLILIVFSTLYISGKAQNVDDALRYSQLFYTGTARFNAMGGAFTALGGDLSAISLNPAATGVFRSFDISLTPQLNYNNSSAAFNGSSTPDFRYSLNFNQFGVVKNLLSGDKESGLINLNIAYSFNKTNNFNENTTIKGVSDNSSMADYWARQSEGTYYKDLRGAAGIAYDAWIIDTVSNSGATRYATTFSNYGTNTNSTYGQSVKRVISNEGYSAEHSISIGGNLSNKLYFGLSFIIDKIKFTGHYQHLETDADNMIFDFKNFTYTDHLDASGTGYSAKLGVIYRPVDFLRIGASFHAPVIYRISETFYDNISSSYDNNDKYEFANDPLKYKYTLTTPGRLNLGVAFQIQKLAILSADYEFVDYRMAQFSNASDSYDYSSENESIRSILKSTSNLRFGTEFRISNVYLRAGYSYFGKALAQGEVNSDSHFNALSFGIGMRQQNFYFDMCYSAMFGSSKYLMYNIPEVVPATITSLRNTFSATFGVKF